MISQSYHPSCTLTISTSGGIILDVPVILGSASIDFGVANSVDAVQVGRTTLSQVDASDLGGVGDSPKKQELVS